MIEMTVALPMYKAGKIAEVTLESLCAQKEINFEWELIVIEESKMANNPLVFGKKNLMSYKKRLYDVGCRRIKYTSIDEWIPLSHKWIDIYENRTKTSKAFMLQAADCWAHSLRLAVSYQKIVKEEFDWYQQEAGYFYDVESDKIAYYSLADTAQYHPCALNMTANMKHLHLLSKEGVAGGVDSWIFNKIRPEKVYLDKVFYKDGLDINGHNVLSHDRGKMITEGILPFTKTEKKLEDVIPDKNIIKILRKSRKDLPLINTRFPSVTTVIIWHRDEKVFMGAISSANRQVYPGIHKANFIDNRKDIYNVPQAMNEAVRKCQTEYIDFLGDDDLLCKEYSLSLMMALEAALAHGHKNPVCVCSNMTLIGENGKGESQQPKPIWALSPGMWQVEWLREHPFDETVTKEVNANYYETMQKEFGIEPIHAFWNFGYFYHQGKDNLSGNKFDTITQEGKNE